MFVVLLVVLILVFLVLLFLVAMVPIPTMMMAAGTASMTRVSTIGGGSPGSHTGSAVSSTCTIVLRRGSMAATAIPVLRSWRISVVLLLLLIRRLLIMLLRGVRLMLRRCIRTTARVPARRHARVRVAESSSSSAAAAPSVLILVSMLRRLAAPTPAHEIACDGADGSVDEVRAQASVARSSSAASVSSIRAAAAAVVPTTGRRIWRRLLGIAVLAIRRAAAAARSGRAPGVRWRTSAVVRRILVSSSATAAAAAAVIVVCRHDFSGDWGQEVAPLERVAVCVWVGWGAGDGESCSTVRCCANREQCAREDANGLLGMVGTSQCLVRAARNQALKYAPASRLDLGCFNQGKL
ncbi:uncharacterized protein B0I36DRAFT_133314 [Microdochium trichocladiopsis]|uniref:Uncharacterized protein n=1 Tax=Microdochium trichocladiopsis TaxID=1682393 RepID=A0A9P8Y6X7_9PEZI|nr:uncharacterized protein B0I36DRAFT_133314 [Microdochium trichocladiopsis]KAH7029503.1 hypothetical protein B0I36DRAFT_133314 [Microdochium trichocladiopsis]